MGAAGQHPRNFPAPVPPLAVVLLNDAVQVLPFGLVLNARLFEQEPFVSIIVRGIALLPGDEAFPLQGPGLVIGEPLNQRQAQLFQKGDGIAVNVAETAQAGAVPAGQVMASVHPLRPPLNLRLKKPRSGRAGSLSQTAISRPCKGDDAGVDLVGELVAQALEAVEAYVLHTVQSHQGLEDIAGIDVFTEIQATRLEKASRSGTQGLIHGMAHFGLEEVLRHPDGNGHFDAHRLRVLQEHLLADHPQSVQVGAQHACAGSADRAPKPVQAEGSGGERPQPAP